MLKEEKLDVFLDAFLDGKKPAQDTDLDLEDREYITEGTGSYTDEKGEPCEVRIRLKLEPVEEKAYMDTWTKISGFSMHLEGEVPLQDTP